LVYITPNFTHLAPEKLMDISFVSTKYSCSSEWCYWKWSQTVFKSSIPANISKC